MASFENQFHRTLVQYLIDSGETELAAVMVDGGVSFSHDEQGFVIGMYVEVPTSAFQLLDGASDLQPKLIKAANDVANGHIGSEFAASGEASLVQLRVKLIDVEKGWQSVVRELIVNQKGSNQATISRKLFLRDRRNMLPYNEASYSSQAEIRIAQELEQCQVLFFPLPLAIRAETRENYRDHREPDFVVCDSGTWGILEVSFHPNRFDKDAEKDSWFKKSGILCIQHYTAERCYKEPEKVVEEFLGILAKHRR